MIWIISSLIRAQSRSIMIIHLHPAINTNKLMTFENSLQRCYPISFQMLSETFLMELFWGGGGGGWGRSWRCQLTGCALSLFIFSLWMRTFSSQRWSREESLVAVVFSPPVMLHMPLFCTLASLLVLVLAAVAHAAALISITQQTLPV